MNSTGHILIPDIDADVVPLTSEELLLYKAIEFNPEHFKDSIGASRLRYEAKVH